jgi:aspartyl-tRNA(Asn)/glutamyl-tRNA(Gln) amidotransferase subunit C
MITLTFNNEYDIVTYTMTDAVKKKTITEDVVRYVARLSRLHLEEKEVTRFQNQLSKILEYIMQLDEVDTEATLPTSHVLPSMKNVFREDKAGVSLSQEEALSSAPSKKDGFFMVPKVVKDA